MDKVRIKALQKQVAEWKRYSEPPQKINRMVADQVLGHLTEQRAKTVDYLTKQLANVKTLRDVMAAKSSFIDDQAAARSSLKYAALPTGRLKAERPKTYTENLVLARELRARKADKEADLAAMRAEALSQDYLYDPGFQEILGNALTREGMFLAPSMIPTMPIEQITSSLARQNLIGVMPYSDIIKEIADGDERLFRTVTALVEADYGRHHLPEKLRMEYYDLGKLQVHQEATLDDMMAGWDPDRREKFLANLPPDILTKYTGPPPEDMSRIIPGQKADGEHDAAIIDIARGIIADERAALTKDIASMKSESGGST